MSREGHSPGAPLRRIRLSPPPTIVPKWPQRFQVCRPVSPRLGQKSGQKPVPGNQESPLLRAWFCVHSRGDYPPQGPRFADSAGQVTREDLWRKGDRSELAGSTGDVDERSRFADESIDFSPTTHEDLELPPGAARILAGKVDHLGAVRSDGVDLGELLLDVAVPGDDEPTLSGHLGDPVWIFGSGHCDRTRWTLPLLDTGAGITWICEVGALSTEQLGQAENVCIEVETDRRRLSRGHAAWRGSS